MARKGSKSDGSNSVSGYRFINVQLDKADKVRLGALDGLAEFPLSHVSALVQEGYKVSFSEDSKNHSFIASLTDQRETSPFYKCILTGRGTTATNAWVSLCYKHIYMAQEDWSNIATEDTANGSDFG